MNSSYNSDEQHVCRYPGYGHPIPPEDPARLQGPEVGELVRYRYRGHAPSRRSPGENFRDRDNSWWWDIIVRVIHRSYVWSPGECSAKGGYRHYDWSVIQYGPGESSTMVVDDDELFPLVLGQRIEGLPE